MTKMTVTFRVFKKASSNNKVTIYLGRRDFVDHVTGSDPVDGVLNVDRADSWNISFFLKKSNNHIQYDLHAGGVFIISLSDDFFC